MDDAHHVLRLLGCYELRVALLPQQFHDVGCELASCLLILLQLRVVHVAYLGKFAAIVQVFDGVVRGHTSPGGCSGGSC